jgi:hypothetical protein
VYFQKPSELTRGVLYWRGLMVVFGLCGYGGYGVFTPWAGFWFGLYSYVPVWTPGRPRCEVQRQTYCGIGIGKKKPTECSGEWQYYKFIFEKRWEHSSVMTLREFRARA